MSVLIRFIDRNGDKPQYTSNKDGHCHEKSDYKDVCTDPVHC